MKIKTKIMYEESYLPTKRHRIPRIRTVEEEILVELREVNREDAPIAMVVTDYRSYVDENGDEHFGLRDSNFHVIDGLLYSEKRDMWGALDKGAYSVDQFLHDIDRNGNCLCVWNASKRSKKDILCSVYDFLNSHVMVDGVIYQQTNEPRYVVHTFGLGHNHGGTALMIDFRYNENIGKDNYFNALQRNEAITYADKVALSRGDTKDVGTFGDKRIEVLIPEMVRCNPQAEHGDGDAFMNSIENIIQNSDNTMEAGLLAILQLR